MPNTIADNLARLQAARTAIAGAITAKGGTVASGDGLEDFPTDIATIPSGGGGSVSENDVTFYDYDGTVVNAYSKTDFLALSAMPANPTHEGLTAQGWNYSLADAKAYVTKYGRLNISQMYITSDGKTRIYITLQDGRTSPILKLYLNANTEVDVDWGDGTAHSTWTTTSAGYKDERHNYAASGDYVIAITVTTGSVVLQSSVTSISTLLTNGNNNTDSPDRAYLNSIQKIGIGGNLTRIGNHELSLCSSLASVTIPDSVTSIGDSEFLNCSSLASVTIPDSVTSIRQTAFQNCSSLASVTIPDSVTSIGQSAFQNCSSLASVTIPDSVTSIGQSAFNACSSLGFIKFEGETPPTAGGSGTFSGIPTDCTIYVPTGSLSAYQSESNYPNPATYTYVEY